MSSAPARASKACEACAEHHLKCEDDKPCRRCKQKNIACITAPRVPNGDCVTLSLQPPQPGATEAEPSVRSHRASLGPNEEPATQRTYHDLDPLDPGSLDPGPNDGILLQPRTDEIRSCQPQTLTEPNGVPQDCVDTLPSHHLLSTPPSGANTPNRFFGFGFETDLDFSALDLSFLDTYNTQVPFEFESQIGHITERHVSPTEDYEMQGNVRRECRLSGDVPQQSIWRFVPVPTDGGFAEHGNLSLPHHNGIIQSPESFGDFKQRATKEKLDPASRDKILAIILSQMRMRAYPTLSAFPSTELLDHLIQFFLAGPVPKASSWIHCASFQPRLAKPELLLAMAAYGAVLTPDRSLRKLGFALQKVVRNHLPSVFEDNNTTICDLQLHQAYLLQLEIGLWSGNSRKMEISESFQQPLLTMVRRRGYFKRSGHLTMKVHPDDKGMALDKKWKDWIVRESTKRLAYHLIHHDAQSSISFLVSPLVSYSELDLPLPESLDLWLAASAGEWKRLYLEKYSNNTIRIPSLNACIADLDLLEYNKPYIDTSLSCSAILHALWGLVWEYRKVSLLFCGQPRIWDSGMAILCRYQELTKIFDYYRITFDGESLWLLELLSMHLHMSLEEIQLFAGLGGIEQERRVQQSIKEWVKSKRSRQAVWHAGQVYRTIKSLPPQHLRDFHAVSLFHASFAFWAYGLASRMFCQDADNHNSLFSESLSHSQNQNIWLDSEETTETYRYISLGMGIPILQGVSQDTPPAQLTDPAAIMSVIIQNLRQGDSEPLRPNSPLVENLISIMQRLRDTTMGGYNTAHG